MSVPVILHIPHASLFIPEEYRREFRLDDVAIRRELFLMTDRYCDRLFTAGDERVVFPVSRLVCDPERFRDDLDEPMAAVGMGAVYTRRSDGSVLRDVTPARREAILRAFYDPHHERLTRSAALCLSARGSCLIVDCHSFSPVPLPHEPEQADDRPDFCIGTDPFHTPPALADAAVGFLSDLGYRAAVDHPFSGTIVPMTYYRAEPRVKSIMIEVNRALYMNADGTPCGRFEQVKADLDSLTDKLRRAVD